MKKKNLAALTLAIAMGATCLTGCELVTTNNQRDMAQIVAEVDISKSEDFSEGGEYAQYADMIDVETVDKRQLVAYFVNVGNPHAVIVTENLSDSAFSEAMELTRIYDVNTEMVKIGSDNSFTMRVCERGSGETLACGSGAAAAASAINRMGLAKFPMTARLKGGKLIIDTDSDGVVRITGAAEINYTGEIDIFQYGQIKRQLF